jgi:hypothetical protein
MPEDKVLQIFGPTREEITGRQAELHNMGLHNLHFSCNIIRVIKLKR